MRWTAHQANGENIWTYRPVNGKEIVWKGFGVGPIVLSHSERMDLCQKLLQIGENNLNQVATAALYPFQGIIEKSLILHSTTADLGAFQGDLAKLQAALKPRNYAGYTETRSPFLGKADDLAVGRMASWKISVVKAEIELLDIPNLNYYYLSDVLLLEAAKHLEAPQPTMQRMIQYLQKYPHAVVRLYVLDKSLQIFLIWLKRQAGLDRIHIDANSPNVAAVWNNKNILYPSVTAAKNTNIKDGTTPYQVLAAERKDTLFKKELGLDLPGLPGYVIKRDGEAQPAFLQQLLDAAQLLQARYGIEKGCLKACEAGDGGRITPNIDLTDVDALNNLGEVAYTYGDDYVLESHVNYVTIPFGKGMLKLAPSAHIRSGKLAAGITLQFTKGASWAGNLYVTEQLAPQLGITKKEYQVMRQTVGDFLTACQREYKGLTIGGFDFAMGEVGGKFGNDIMLGVQDPNISFNGAEFLREFMTRTSWERGWAKDSFFAATWVFVPVASCTHDALESLLEQETSSTSHAIVVSVVPGFWAMIGIAALEYSALVQQLEHLQKVIGIKSNQLVFKF